MSRQPVPPGPALSRRRALALGLAGTAALGLSGCGIADPAPKDHFYRLAVDAPAGVADGRPPVEGQVLVPSLEGGGVLNQRALLWTTNGVQLQQYSYHFWAEPPAELFQDTLVNTLRAANTFQGVIQPSHRQRPDWIIRGRIRRLELIGGGADSPVQQARVGLTLLVTDPDDERVLMERAYDETVPVPDGTVAAGAAALGRATETIYRRFLGDLAGLEFRKTGRFGRR